MRWRGRRESKNIEDTRNTSGGARGRGGSGGGGFRLPGGMGGGNAGSRLPRSPAKRAGGGGIGLIIVLGILFFLFTQCSGGGNNVATRDGGIMPQTQQQTQTRTQPQTQTPPSTAGRGDPKTEAEMGQFVGVVLAETEDTWRGIFQAQGRQYQEPKLRMFSDRVQSACGNASSASGPFYCPADSRIYLDTAFFRQLERQFGASGDFAQAYVIAHEVGHHVQNIIGVLPKFNQLRQRMSKTDTNQMSIRVELQADCFAGIWAHFANKKGLLETGDIDEALNAATQIGDDTIQRRTQGYVVPESFNHGTSKQRKAWFYRGFETGRLRDCDTKIFG
ncbi:neutral zinc metallopeptidase [Pseudahrensia aquimaris]|uniref:Neutral zinc metallopeptidase n=1 Tax=Pseudahrensia aquimaris TaxID=744461 RepID=A0ABW3FHP4_9HYPH